MCVALILFTNSFYKVYYWLFDLCEHALVSLLLLATVFLFFLPVLVNIESDEQRPLFTIAVLVSGVVGGLAVVITVVYLYRFCLKKRQPVTTTSLPENKREQIRSNTMSQCRPLALPLFSDKTTFISTSSSKEYLKDKESFGSPTRIAQVFPLISKENSIPYIQRSVQDVFHNKNTSFLSVVDPPYRTHSDELLQVAENPELRRASFDVPRGIGRQLPSTEGLETKYAERTRRNTFSRSNAIQESIFPIKQNSSPLPEHPRIYDRGHMHSRSWNPEGVGQTSTPQSHYQHYQMDEMYQPELQYIPPISESRVHLGVRQFQRQAKSFDERGSAIANARRRSVEPDRTFARQNTVQMLQPETPVAAACQSLWAAKGHLEQLQALGINDPSSASTSFESNTENNQAPNVLDVKDREKNAENKRLIYKSLLIQRKFLSTAAVSSVESSNSTESSAPEHIFASSVDSQNSDLEHRRILLMEHKTASSPQIQPHPTTSIEPIETAKGRIGRRIVERDYSVDAQSDNLFREWSRVDPAYAERDTRGPIRRGMTEDHSAEQRHRSYTRQMSVGGVTVPLICYSDVQNCSR